MIKSVVILLFITQVTFCATMCKSDQIMRRDNEMKYICCKTVTCEIGQKFAFCTKDQGHDTCSNCPAGTYHLDTINTAMMNTILDPCIQKPTCDQPEVTSINGECVCDRSRSYYGNDINNCLLARISCSSPGYELKNNGKCEPCDDDYFKPEASAEHICRQKTRCFDTQEIDSNGTTTQDRSCRARTAAPTAQPAPVQQTNKNKTGNLVKDESQSWIIVSSAFIFIVVLVTLVILFYWKKRRKLDYIFCNFFRNTNIYEIPTALNKHKLGKNDRYSVTHNGSDTVKADADETCPMTTYTSDYEDQCNVSDTKLRHNLESKHYKKIEQRTTISNTVDSSYPLNTLESNVDLQRTIVDYSGEVPSTVDFSKRNQSNLPLSLDRNNVKQNPKLNTSDRKQKRTIYSSISQKPDFEHVSLDSTDRSNNKQTGFHEKQRFYYAKPRESKTITGINVGKQDHVTNTNDCQDVMAGSSSFQSHGRNDKLKDKTKNDNSCMGITEQQSNNLHHETYVKESSISTDSDLKSSPPSEKGISCSTTDTASFAKPEATAISTNRNHTRYHRAETNNISKGDKNIQTSLNFGRRVIEFQDPMLNNNLKTATVNPTKREPEANEHGLLHINPSAEESVAHIAAGRNNHPVDLEIPHRNENTRDTVENENGLLEEEIDSYVFPELWIDHSFEED